MKKLLFLSGKGGTGKTTVAGAFIGLSQREPHEKDLPKAYADCDVDAPNLHLILKTPPDPRVRDYRGMDKAEIDPALCVLCGECEKHCRFGAISLAGIPAVDFYACEGCGVCAAVCPQKAIRMKANTAGEMRLYLSPGETFSTATLLMGNGNSGLLVTEVKKALESAPPGTRYALIDGSPGIGCPVIASLSGVDMVLLVAEPSLSGISDLERIAKTAAKFNIKTAVCVNKHDSSPGNTAKIEEFCKTKNLPMLGKIPFDPMVVKAVNEGKSITDIPCAAGRAVEGIYVKTMEALFAADKRREKRDETV